MEQASIEDFYRQLSRNVPDDFKRGVGHFNVFETRELKPKSNGPDEMPYSRRDYYKISFIDGHNRAEYADKVIDIERYGLLFATPRIPYHYVPQGGEQNGMFCVFTSEFLARSIAGTQVDQFPIFQPGAYPVFRLEEDQVGEIRHIFRKMQQELASDYLYKYDLLRNYVIELIHYGQKLQRGAVAPGAHNAAERISALFIELLERQFPIDPSGKRLLLKTPKDYADRLSVHVNHLNRVLKEYTGKTTSALISRRIAQEAKILLRQTDWNISEIAYSLGFEEVAHFSNFFKKQTTVTALAFRH